MCLSDIFCCCLSDIGLINFDNSATMHPWLQTPALEVKMIVCWFYTLASILLKTFYSDQLFSCVWAKSVRKNTSNKHIYEIGVFVVLFYFYGINKQTVK